MSQARQVLIAGVFVAAAFVAIVAALISLWRAHRRQP